MRPRHRAALLVRAVVVALLAPAIPAAIAWSAADARAQDAPPPGADPVEARMVEAKRLFEQGNALRKSGDCERAVVFFERSRALQPSVPNTLNAAVCLSELGRFDEALELHLKLSAELGRELREDERAWLVPEVARLESLVETVTVVTEAGAAVAIDRRWRGTAPLPAPLPVLPGRREIRITKAGFQTYLAPIEARAGGRSVVEARLQPLGRADPPAAVPPVPVPPDPAPAPAPAAPEEAPASFWIEAIGSAALTPALGSGAEASCDAFTCDEGPGVGFTLGGRVGYELPMRLSFELSAGYLSVTKHLARTVDESFQARDGQTVATRYGFEDAISLSGPILAAGIGYRRPLTGPLEMSGHLGLGAFFSSSRDEVTGQASAGGDEVDVEVAGSGQSTGAVDPFIAPEIRLGLRSGGWSAALGVTVFAMLLEGPDGNLGDTSVTGACDPDVDPRAVECAPGEALLGGERAYGPFVLVSPGLSVRRTF